VRHQFNLLALLAVFLALPGCTWFSTSVNQDFVGASKQYADVVFPEYERYVDGDPALDADTKTIRKDTVKAWRRLIDDAAKE
jgi:hypothetical protein